MSYIKRKKTHLNPSGETRALNVHVDAVLWQRLHWISRVTKIPRWKLVEQGIRCRIQELHQTWPKEMFMLPGIDMTEEEFDAMEW